METKYLDQLVTSAWKQANVGIKRQVMAKAQDKERRQL